MKFQAILCGLAAGLAALGQVPPDWIRQYPVANVFFSEGRAVLVKPTRQVFFGAVGPVDSRYDSRFLAFAGDPHGNQGLQSRDPNTIQASIYLYDLNSGTLTKAVDLANARIELSGMMWLPGSKLLYYEGVQNGQEFSAIYDPESKRSATIPMAKLEGRVSYPLVLSEGRDLVYYSLPANHVGGFQLAVYSLPTRTWRIIPETVDPGLVTSDGSHIYRMTWERERKEVVATAQFDLAAGRWGPVSDPMIERRYPPFDVQAGAREVVIGPNPSRVENGVEDRTTKFPPVRVAAEAVQAGCTVDGRHAFFVDRGGLEVVPLQVLSREEFEALFRDNVRQQAMSRAKQVGLGLLIYCSDYDDQLPPADDWQSRIDPYIKNRELTNGFTYLLNGQNNAELKDPSNTAMGIVDTPIGSAIVRGDGSVIWKDRPKSMATATLEALRN